MDSRLDGIILICRVMHLLLCKSEFIEVRQMTIQTVEKNNIMCAVINSDEKVFTDAQSACIR